MDNDDQRFLPGFPEPEPQAFARRDDPETSHEAAASVERIRETQYLVLCCLNAIGPQDDLGIAQWWWNSDHKNISSSGLRTRRSEMVARGLVRHSGEYGRSSSGRRTRIWEITEAGRRLLEERRI